MLGMFFIGVALATVLVDGGGTTFSSVNESSVSVYNFSVDNTQATENVSEVNVTLPSGFVFVSGSNDTDVASSVFSNASLVLSWSDSSLVENGTLSYFWFNVTSSSTSGNYNITITVSNSTGIFETQNLSITVNDTVSPQVVIVYPANASSYATSPTQLNFTYTEANCDKVWFSNDSGVSNSTAQACTSNFTSLVSFEGDNNWTVYMNDSTGNENSSVAFFTVDTVNPVASAACSPSSVISGGTISCTCSGTDSGSGINSALTTADSTPSTSSAGTFSYTCSVTDNAGNSHSEDASYTVTSSSISSGGSPTYRPSESRFLEGYSVSLGRGFSVDFSLGGESHSLVVDSISGDSATITISSDPIALSVDVGDTETVDLDLDGEDDFSVHLKSIGSSRANFVFSFIGDFVIEDGEVVSEVEETVSDEVVVSEVVEDAEKGGSLWTVIIIIGLIIFGIKVMNKRNRK